MYASAYVYLSNPFATSRISILKRSRAGLNSVFLLIVAGQSLKNSLSSYLPIAEGGNQMDSCLSLRALARSET